MTSTSPASPHGQTPTPSTSSATRSCSPRRRGVAAATSGRSGPAGIASSPPSAPPTSSHLTCHGEFAPREPARSGVLFSNGSERPPRALEELSPDERPPFLVSVSDLLATRMQARLVTLRACSTGLQSMRNAGDEFDGLTRALLEAGAQSALVSLWNVDQRSSRELLERFYTHWTDRTEPGGAAQALALAQRELIDLGDPVLAHPYHWAPFALIGDWR